MQAIAKRIIKEMFRDLRTLALIFLVPILLFTLFYFLFQTSGEQKATLLVRNVDTQVVSALDNKNLVIKKVAANEKTAKQLVRAQDKAGMLEQTGSKLTLTLANSDQGQTMIIKQSLQQVQVKLKMAAAQATIAQTKAQLEKLSQQLATVTKTSPAVIQPTVPQNYAVKAKYLYGSKDSTYFETLLPILMGFIVFFLVFLISGMGILKERTSGTLYRMLATPVKRSRIIYGYLLGYGTFAILQTILIVLFVLTVFKVPILGNLFLVILINLLIAFVALALGLFVSSFAKSEFQMMQFMPLIVVPQVFFAGIIPISLMPGWVQAIAKIMPLYYGANGLTAVIQKGAGLSKVMGDLGVLALMILVIVWANIFSMRKYRKV